MSAEARPTIHVLPEEAVAKIAAGEVVERPAAALKELIENALDARARRIEASMAGGGIDLLEVVDDGEGIEAGALPLALTRHATSKIDAAEDLLRLGTYGFRGEALPAIAAAAGRLVVSSARADLAGAEVVVEDGRAGPVLPAAQAPGTRVRVEALFSRLPARRAFLRAPAAEAAACHEVVLRAALSAPGVAVRLRSERGEVFASAGSGDRADVLARAYGTAVRAALLPVAYREGAIQVEGYVAEAAFARSTRAAQTFLVRGRPVTGRSLVYAAESAYAGRLPRGRFPVFAISIELEPGAVDVNIHPQKREVRFRDERRVASAVHMAVRRALEGGTTALGAGGTLAAPAPGPVASTRPAAALPTGEWAAGHPAPAPVAQSRVVAWPSEWAAAREAEAPPAPGDAPARPPAPLRPLPAPAESLPQVPERLAAAPCVFVGLTPIRQLRLLYIVAEAADGLYLVDQHAAHERVRYEALEAADGAGRGPARQRLLPALVLPLPPTLVEVCADNEADLLAAGFVAQPFGADAVRVSEAPAGVNLPGQVLRDLLGTLSDPSDNQPLAHRRRALIACRTSVRAGDSLALPEMVRILRDLAACRAPETCPHGRPTVHRLAWDEIGAFFRRRA